MAGPIGGEHGEPPGFRFVVTDGATETYESRRWVDYLVGSFMSADRTCATGWPDIERGSIGAWFKAMQDQWWAAPHATRDAIEKLKLRQGTLATFVGGQITGLNTATPVWQAATLGDSVLFHVRDGNLITQVPELRAADFASTPEGISTLPEKLGRMSEQLQIRDGYLEPGDMIFVATDAFAKWMVTRVEARDRALWPLLGELTHPSVFDQLVAKERRNAAIKDDDVTLLRIRIQEKPASTVIICLLPRIRPAPITQWHCRTQVPLLPTPACARRS